MEEIAKHLKDPSWWFTAFFIAILASVIAGFLKDRIEKWIGSLSSGLRAWRDERQKYREMLIDSLFANERYVYISLFRMLTNLILFSISIVLYSTGPVLISMMPEHEQNVVSLDKSFLAWNIMMPLLGLLSAYIGYKTTTRISIISEVIRRYRIENDLPKLL